MYQIHLIWYFESIDKSINTSETTIVRFDSFRRLIMYLREKPYLYTKSHKQMIMCGKRHVQSIPYLLR